MIRDWINQNLKNLSNEIRGENVEHPFIRRILAYGVDFFIFGFLNAIYVLVASEKTNGAGNFFYITIGLLTAYFSLGNSKLFGGQTIGKSFFNIRVLNEKGQTIGIVRSVVRSTPIALLTNSLSIMQYFYYDEYSFRVVTLFLMPMFFGVVYFGLIKLNHQGIHDLIASTQVTERSLYPVTSKNLSPKLILGYILIVAGATLYLLDGWSLI